MTHIAPFAATQEQRVREKAQQALASFVEHQIKLEEELDVASWGDEAYRNALSLAQEGDKEFLAERYDAALDAYSAANDAIGAVTAMADDVFNNHIRDAQTAIDRLQPEKAQEAVTAALAIKPKAATALQTEQRVATLPDVINLLRTAKNHELSERFEDALATYESIRALDPATAVLAERIAAVQVARNQNLLRTAISDGFQALERGRFNQARNAFNRALKLEPNNEIALGGLAQVAARNDLAIIRQTRTQAESAMAKEEWQAAIDAYQKILSMDNKIQFAVTGIANAKEHLRATTLLSKIVSEPERLSAENLYVGAQEILAQARELEPGGERLSAQANRVEELLTLYRDPVTVTLLSDSATDIVISNVGRLGFFDEKILSLRPGRYTIRGSQNGCRDLYLTVDILPGIEPLNLSCPERLP